MANLFIEVSIPWPITREELNKYRDRYDLIGTRKVACLGETVMPDGSIVPAPGYKPIQRVPTTRQGFGTD